MQSQPVRKAESREMKPSDEVEGKIEDKAERRSGDNEVSDPAGGGMELDSLNNGSMVFVNELQTQLEYLKKSLSLRGIDLEAVRTHTHTRYSHTSNSNIKKWRLRCMNRRFKSCSKSASRRGSSRGKWRS